MKHCDVVRVETVGVLVVDRLQCLGLFNQALLTKSNNNVNEMK